MTIGRLAGLFAGCCLAAFASARADTTLTIATVNNADMITMQKLSHVFEEENPGIHLRWVTLEENVLRQRLTTDITTNSGQFDVMAIGLFEAPMWGKNGWLLPFSDPPAAYDMADVLPSVRAGLSYGGKLYSLPFYGESQMTIYRTDLFRKAGLTMPEQPTWADIARDADALDDPKHGVYGICLRGKPGWGENVGQVGPMVNSYGGRWFNMAWQPQLTTPPWEKAVSTYVGLLRKDGPPGSSSNGYNEILTLFASGRCAMWVDATVSGGLLSNPATSSVAHEIGFAKAPYGTVDKGNHYLWVWALAIPKSTRSPEAAKKFVYWATSKQYIQLVAKTDGEVAVPPGTRASTYDAAYLAAAPFAKLTLEAMETANMNDATVQKVPYRGISFAEIPPFPAIGNAVGNQISAAIAGDKSVRDALAASQVETTRLMQQAGYLHH